MMDATIVSIALWIPFGLSVLIAGLIFCISGYRKGLGQAAVGLAAVVIATVATVLLANLVSMLFSGASDGSIEGIALAMVKRPLLSLLFFWLLMPIVTIIFRSIANRIVKKRHAAPQTWQKLLGMVLGLVSAVVFSLFWLSPLYGSVEMAVGVADSVMTATQNDDLQLQSLLDAAGKHPLVTVSKGGPIKWVYQSTAQMGNGIESFSVTAMVESGEHCIALITQLENAETPEEAARIGTELIEYIRTDVVGEVWFYQLYKSGISTLLQNLETMDKAPIVETYRLCEVILDEDGDGHGYFGLYHLDQEGNFVIPVYGPNHTPESPIPLETIFVDEDYDGTGIYVNTKDLPYEIVEENSTLEYNGMEELLMGQIPVTEDVKQLLPIFIGAMETLDVDRKTFDANMDNLFGFLSRAMDAGLWSALEGEDRSILQNSDIVEDAGWLANSTQEAVAVKRVLIATFLMSQNADAAQMMEQYDFSMITDPELQTQEASLLFKIILGDDCSLGEFVLEHPSLGVPAFQKMAEERSLAELCDLNEYDQKIFDQLAQQYPQIEEYVLDHCRETTGNMQSPSAKEICQALCYVVHLRQSGSSSETDPSAAALTIALDYYGDKWPEPENPRLCKDIMEKILKVYPEALAGYEGQTGTYTCDMYWLATLLDYMLEQQAEGMSDYNWFSTLQYTAWYMQCENPVSMVKYLVDTRGNDPLQIRNQFSQSTRDQLKQDLGEFAEWYNVVERYKEVVYAESFVVEEDGKQYLITGDGVRYEISEYGDFPEELLPSEEYVQEQKARIRENLQYLIRFLGF